MLGQALHIGSRCGGARIDTQRHRRVLVVGLEHGLPLARPVALQGGDPPGGVVEGGGRVLHGGGHQHGPLAQEAPQHGVDERCAGGVALARSSHRLVDQGVLAVGRVPARPQQGQRGQQQRVQAGSRRLRCQPQTHRQGPAQAAQDLKAQRLGAGSGLSRAARQGLVQRLAGANRLHRVGRVVEQLRQRQRARRRCGQGVRGRIHDRSLRAGCGLRARSTRLRYPASSSTAAGKPCEAKLRPPCSEAKTTCRA